MAPLFSEYIGTITRGDRRNTFDTGAAVPSRTTTGGNAVRARLQGIISQVPKYKNTYEHEPINPKTQIRILKIIHGKEDDKLQCMLYPSNLGSGDPYYALSYWWGDEKEVASNKIEIFYDTHGRGTQRMTAFNTSGSYYIRNNLKSALKRFRSLDKDIDVWVDALCINQEAEDKTEKKIQVARMHEVYTSAEKVYIWLGEGTQGKTTETFDFLKDILDLENLDHLVANPLQSAEKWALVIDLMKNRWFSRRWVIQELALSRNAAILWGDEVLEWDNFADAIALFMTKYEEIKRTSLDPRGLHPSIDCRALGANTIVHATTNLFRKTKEGHVQQRLLPLELLVSSWLLAFEASEPRDTIFAVLTLAKDSNFAESLNTDAVKEDSRIAPDYNKSLLDVYADFIDYCIDKSQSLDILCRYWAPLPKSPSIAEALKHGKTGGNKEDLKNAMPSWIPFIDKSAFGEPHLYLGGRINGDSLIGGSERKGQKPYNADGGLRAWYKFGEVKVTPEKGPLTPAARSFTMPSNFGKNQENGKAKPGKLKSIQESDKHSNLNGSTNVLSPATHSGPSRFNGSTQLPSAVTTGGPRPSRFDGTLQVKGMILDSIGNDMVSNRVVRGIIPREALTMAGWIHRDPPIEHQEVPDQLWRTLVGDRGPNGTSAPTWYRRACLECLEHTDRMGDLDIESLKKKVHPKKTPSMMINFLDRVHQIVWGRRFFQTKGKPGKESLFGLGSTDIRENDIIAILFGCSVPVVLRRVTEPGGKAHHHRFIGECYVHGMMDGEAIVGKPPSWKYDGKKYLTFTLK